MSAFGDAFKAARAAGKKTFTFNGKSYHTRTKEDEGKPASKPMSGIQAAPKAAAKPKSSDLDREINREGARQVQKSQETAMQKTTPNADNKDDTSLSVSERIKRAKDRARTSNTGTDTRSVSERIKSALKSAGDAISPTAGMVRRGREAMEKEMGKGMKRGGTVRGDGIAKRGKTKGKMC